MRPRTALTHQNSLWRRTQAVATTAAVLAATALAAGCTSNTDDPPDKAPDEAAEVTVEVNAQDPVTVSVGDVTITGPAGAFTKPGTITVTATSLTPDGGPGQPGGLNNTSDPGGPGDTGDLSGVDVTFDQTRLRKPLTVTFPAPEKPAGKHIPVFAHRDDDGTWSYTPAVVRGDTFAVTTTEFSFWGPDWLDPRNWWDSVIDALGGRTDPDDCENNGPTWANLDKQTTLVHTCLISNTDNDTGKVRAEAQLKSNRRFYTKVAVPAGAEYVWNSDGDTALGKYASRIPGLVAPGEQILFPQKKITAGYLRPQGDSDLTFTTFVDNNTLALSLIAPVLSVVNVTDNRGGWAALWGLKSCGSEIPADLGNADGWGHFLACVFSDALGSLKDDDKAAAAALDLLGDAAYDARQEAQETFKNVADTAKLVGKVLGIIGAASLVRDVFQQFPDTISQLGEDRPGDVTLRLDGLYEFAQLSSVDQLKSAPIPPTCGHPAATLTNGTADFGTNGSAALVPYIRPVIADLTRDGSTDILIVMDCNAGGVAHPQKVLLYQGGPRLAGWVDLGDTSQREKASVSSLAQVDGGVRVTWDAYDGAGGYDTDTWVGTLVWDGSRLRMQGARTFNTTGDCGAALTRAVNSDRRFIDLRVDRCDGRWAYLGDAGAAGDTEQLWKYYSGAWRLVTGFPTSLCLRDLEPANPPPWVRQLFAYRGC